MIGSISRDSFVDFTFELSKRCNDFGIRYSRSSNSFTLLISSNKSLEFYLTNNRTVNLLDDINKEVKILSFRTIASVEDYVLRWIINC